MRGIFYELDLLPVWLVPEFGFTTFRGEVEAELGVCCRVENLKDDSEVWVYKECGFSMNTPARTSNVLEFFLWIFEGKWQVVFYHSHILTWAHRAGDALATEVAPQSQKSLDVCVRAKQQGGMSGRPEEAAAAGRQQQNQEEDTWAGRETVINNDREDGLMEWDQGSITVTSEQGGWILHERCLLFLWQREPPRDRQTERAAILQ